MPVGIKSFENLQRIMKKNRVINGDKILDVYFIVFIVSVNIAFMLYLTFTFLQSVLFWD